MRAKVLQYNSHVNDCLSYSSQVDSDEKYVFTGESLLGDLPLLGNLSWGTSLGEPLLGNLSWGTSLGEPLLGNLSWGTQFFCHYLVVKFGSKIFVTSHVDVHCIAYRKQRLWFCMFFLKNELPLTAYCYL